MSDQNSDLSVVTQICCHLVSIKRFNVNMLVSNNWLKQKATIVNRHENLNPHVSITMRQHQCSSDSKYINTDHCCLFMILFSGFNQKYGQAMKINTRFNVNMIATLWYIIKFTIAKYFFGSCVCNMVCYVLYTTYDVVIILLLLHMLLLGCP